MFKKSSFLDNIETMEVFHIDIINDILLRLPAKSLLRFKSVCKTWYNLISSFDFAKTHLKRSLLLQSNLHFVFQNPDLCLGDFDSFENAYELDYPYKKSNESVGVSIVGNCNGLLCLWNYDNDNFFVFLFNPTTQTHKMIPILPRPFHVLHLPHTFVRGFGYDSVADDYKFVRILQCSREERRIIYSEVMVYSLKSDSWTELNGEIPAFECKWPDGVLVRENLHWVGLTKHRELPRPIVRFSLRTNSFDEVGLPEMSVHSQGFIHVGALDGCLCILINGIAEFEIVVMREYGVVESWARLAQFARYRVSQAIVRTITFTRDRKKLFVTLGGHLGVGAIDLEKMVMEEIESNVSPLKRRMDATVCVENLLMLDGYCDFLENEQHGGGKSKRLKQRMIGDVRDTTDLQVHPWMLHTYAAIAADIIDRVSCISNGQYSAKDDVGYNVQLISHAESVVCVEVMNG